MEPCGTPENVRNGDENFSNKRVTADLDDI
jgi:hypothetical protein